MRVSNIGQSFAVKKVADKNKITPTLKNNVYNNGQVCSDCFSSGMNNLYDKAIAFQGVTAKGLVKQRGMLMHITSLPGTRSFCGQFGDIQTTKFINWLSASKQTHWIMNPLNALEEHLCPYSGDGRFSRNKFIVNLNKLTEKEYGEILKESELPDDVYSPVFTYDMLANQKNPRFKIAYSRFKELPETSPIKQEYSSFLTKNDKLWLDDYANYDAIAKLQGRNWLDWDKDLQTAPETAKSANKSLAGVVLPILSSKIEGFSEDEYADNLGLYKFEQFLYDKQIHQLVEELDSKGIRLVFDLPIGVSATGADTWGKKNIFLLTWNKLLVISYFVT